MATTWQREKRLRFLLQSTDHEKQSGLESNNHSARTRPWEALELNFFVSKDFRYDDWQDWETWPSVESGVQALQCSPHVACTHWDEGGQWNTAWALIIYNSAFLSTLILLWKWLVGSVAWFLKAASTDLNTFWNSQYFYSPFPELGTLYKTKTLLYKS